EICRVDCEFVIVYPAGGPRWSITRAISTRKITKMKVDFRSVIRRAGSSGSGRRPKRVDAWSRRANRMPRPGANYQFRSPSYDSATGAAGRWTEIWRAHGGVTFSWRTVATARFPPGGRTGAQFEAVTQGQVR